MATEIAPRKSWSGTRADHRATGGQTERGSQGRADDAPLFLQGDGRPWGDNPGAGYHREVKQIVSAIGADPDVTMYALRHSSIVRMLKVNVPIRLVASLHNTSTKMIEKHYSKYITEHSDDISRQRCCSMNRPLPTTSSHWRAVTWRGSPSPPKITVWRG